MGRGCRPQRHRSWYSTFAPFPDTCPRNQPALGQTGVRGANVNCRAWLTDDSNRSTGGRFRPQAWPPLSAVSDNCLCTQHSAVWPRRRVVLQRQTQIVCRYSTPPACTAQAATRRHFAIRSQRRARSARYKDGSSGGAASTNNFVSSKISSIQMGQFQ